MWIFVVFATVIIFFPAEYLASFSVNLETWIVYVAENFILYERVITMFPVKCTGTKLHKKNRKKCQKVWVFDNMTKDAQGLESQTLDFFHERVNLNTLPENQNYPNFCKVKWYFYCTFNTSWNYFAYQFLQKEVKYNASHVNIHEKT